MSAISKVTGSECLNYINKPIGFSGIGMLTGHVHTMIENDDVYGFPLKRHALDSNYLTRTKNYNVMVVKFDHDITKRIVGYVTNEYEDGGVEIKLLGNEAFNFQHENISAINQTYIYSCGIEYDPVLLEPGTFERVGGFQFAPTVYTSGFVPIPQQNSSGCALNYEANGKATFDELLTWGSEGLGYISLSNYAMPENDDYCAFNFAGMVNHTLSNNPTKTLTFGEGLVSGNSRHISSDLRDATYMDMLTGDIYNYFSVLSQNAFSSAPNKFTSESDFTNFTVWDGDVIIRTNCCDIPYNVILTKNLNFAQAYLEHGTLPPDAFLFPLDWENLPSYTPSDPDDPDDDDGDDDNTPDDTSRDITPDDKVIPSRTPSQLSNYNWYWITQPQFESFINWFWNDIGDVTDWDTLVGKIEGLYSNLASAVLMARYFPVDNLATWIGGLGNAEDIKLGMVEQASSNVDTLSIIGTPILRPIGHVHIPKKYESFVDIAPYTELSVYLPFHGFVDLDVDILVGHDLYVYAMYDHLSGTIQYFLWYDDVVLINTFTAKMAVDIPLSLQSKNDRDSAIFSNVANTVSGLIGAGSTLATGNPIGLMVGANAIMGNQTSAPINVKGSVGETGAFYGPSKCKIILRRPAITKPSNWASIVGEMCGKTYTLKNLSGKGLTVCHAPRITFSSSAPLQSEVDEIYDYLSKGVIL